MFKGQERQSMSFKLRYDIIWYMIIRNENVSDCFSGQLEFSNSEPCTFRTIASFSHGKVK